MLVLDADVTHSFEVYHRGETGSTDTPEGGDA